MIKVKSFSSIIAGIVAVIVLMTGSMAVAAERPKGPAAPGMVVAAIPTITGLEVEGAAGKKTVGAVMGSEIKFKVSGNGGNCGARIEFGDGQADSISALNLASPPVLKHTYKITGAFKAVIKGASIGPNQCAGQGVVTLTVKTLSNAKLSELPKQVAVTQPKLEINPASWDFGPTIVNTNKNETMGLGYSPWYGGENKAKTFTLKNAGGGMLDTSKLFTKKSGSGDISLVEELSTCIAKNNVLGAGMSCSLVFKFLPSQDIGIREAEMAVAYGSWADENKKVISLRGASVSKEGGPKAAPASQGALAVLPSGKEEKKTPKIIFYYAVPVFTSCRYIQGNLGAPGVPVETGYLRNLGIKVKINGKEITDNGPQKTDEYGQFRICLPDKDLSDGMTIVAYFEGNNKFKQTASKLSNLKASPSSFEPQGPSTEMK